MNDLLQLRADLSERYAAVVHGRRSLKCLERVVCSLTGELENSASRVIRPDNVYWAVLSNAVAGAVEHAKALLNEAAEVATYSWPFRFTFAWCYEMGLNADIDDVKNIFLCIKKVVNMSENRNLYHDKVKALRRVNTLGSVSSMGGLHRILSDIKEETIPVA